MIKRIQALPGWQRVAIFLLVAAIAFGSLALVTAVVFISSAQSSPRTVGTSLLPEQVSVREYAILPDAESYPAALTIDADGTLYTGSYSHGAV